MKLFTLPLVLSIALCAASCQNSGHRPESREPVRIERIVVEDERPAPQAPREFAPDARGGRLPAMQSQVPGRMQPRMQREGGERGPRAPRGGGERDPGMRRMLEGPGGRGMQRGAQLRPDARGGFVCPHCGAPLPPRFFRRFLPSGPRGMEREPRGGNRGQRGLRPRMRGPRREPQQEAPRSRRRRAPLDQDTPQPSLDERKS